MNAAMYALLAIAATIALYLIVKPLIRVYARYRGASVITCPETKAPAGVRVNALQAAMSGFGKPSLRLKDCSRWPERQDCGQECLSQIEEAPEDCLVRNMLTKWYVGQRCILCDKPLEEIDWLHHKPALMNRDRRTIEWHEVRPEEIPEVLKTHTPVCWNCHIAESFRRQHPDLVIDR